LQDFFEKGYLLDYTIKQMKPFQVSLWHGISMGGSIGLTWQSQVRVATDTTVFALPQTQIGFFCAYNSSVLTGLEKK